MNARTSEALDEKFVNGKFGSENVYRFTPSPMPPVYKKLPAKFTRKAKVRSPI